MVEAEAKLDEAIRARRAQQRDQRLRLRWTGATAASYAVDALFLGLFAAAGTIPAAIGIGYGLAGAAVCLASWAITASGLNLRLRDPNLTEPLSMIGAALQFAVVAAAPQIAFPYLANLFTVFAFGMIWLSVRESVVIWSLGAVATGVLVYAKGAQFSIPVASGFELALVWLYFSLVLARCLVLSVQASDLRQRVADSRRRLAESLEQVRQLASHDELTGVLNRRALISALERERSRAERSAAPFGIAMIDLDHFKGINDSYGHAVGDEVLKAFAAAVRDTMRVTDVFGRYGGEEFLLILVGTGPAAALEAVERIREAVAARDWRALTPGRPVTISAGIANFSKGDSVEQLLHRADAGLYQAKAAGRNRTIASEP